MDKLERLLATGRINAISPTLADRLGRTDLGGYSPPSGPLDPYSNPMDFSVFVTHAAATVAAFATSLLPSCTATTI
jgi:hypothetical protein